MFFEFANCSLQLQLLATFESPAFLSACGNFGNIRKRCLLHVPGPDVKTVQRRPRDETNGTKTQNVQLT